MKYTDIAINAVKSAIERQKHLKAQEKVLKAEYQAENITAKEFRKQQEEIRRQLQSSNAEAQKKLNEIEKAYIQVVHKAAELDGSKIHEDAKLLQLDLKMTPQQFEALVTKHRENPLMQQLLREYSDKHDGLYADMVPSPTAKAEEFAGFIRTAVNAVRTPDCLQAAMFVEGRYTPQCCTESE